MHAIKRGRRGLCAALSVCLLASASGCRSAEECAVEKSGLVKRGMTRDEVERLLGPPDSKDLRPDQPSSEIWHYTYREGIDPSPIKVIATLVLFSAIVALLVALRCTNLPNLSGGTNAPDTCRIRILFVAETGRVRWVEVVR